MMQQEKVVMGKVCVHCNVWKPYTEYHKQSASYDGYRPRCKQCRVVEIKEYQETHKEYLKEYHKHYYINNKEKYIDYYNQNKDRIQERRRERYHNDPHYRNRMLLSSRLYEATQSQDITKHTNTMQLLGCSKVWLTLWLQYTKLYYCPYSINTHQDHLRPCISFNLADPEEQLDCFSWRNLRTLDASENVFKNSTYPSEKELIVQQKLIYGFRQWMRHNNPHITY